MKLSPQQIYMIKAYIRQVFDDITSKETTNLSSTVKAVKQEGAPTSQLEQMLLPVAQQAEEVLGIPPDRMMDILVGEALNRYSSKESAMDTDYTETDEEEDFVETVDEDEAKMDDEDEEDEGALLVSSSPLRAKKSTTPLNLDAIVAKEVKRQLSHFDAPKGRKNVGVPSLIQHRGNLEWNVIKAVNALRTGDNRVLKHYNAMAKDSFIKAGGLAPDTIGGVLVPIEQSNQLIELLRNASLFLGTGPVKSLITEIPMTREMMTIPRQTGAATAGWIGENTTIPDSQQEYDQLLLQARKLAAFTKLGTELFESSDPAVEAIVNNDLMSQMQLKFDSTLLYGLGSAFSPRGLYADPGVNKVALNAALDYERLIDQINRVRENNVVFDGSMAFIVNPRDVGEIQQLKDDSGRYIFTEDANRAGLEPAMDRVKGYPLFNSNTVNRVTSPNDETDIFFGKWSDILVGMRKGIELRASDVAGDAFSDDQVHIRAIMRCDIAVRHPESFEILTDVRPVA